MKSNAPSRKQIPISKPQGRYELIPAPIEPERKKMTRAQVREAIRNSPLKFNQTSEQLRAETREP